MLESDRGTASNDHRASLNDPPANHHESSSHPVHTGIVANLVAVIDTIKRRINEYNEKARNK